MFAGSTAAASKIEALQPELKELKGKIAALDDKIDQAEEAKDEAAVKRLCTRRDKLEEDMRLLRATLLALQQEKTALQQEKLALQQEETAKAQQLAECQRKENLLLEAQQRGQQPSTSGECKQSLGLRAAEGC